MVSHTKTYIGNVAEVALVNTSTNPYAGTLEFHPDVNDIVPSFVGLHNSMILMGILSEASKYIVDEDNLPSGWVRCGYATWGIGTQYDGPVKFQLFCVNSEDFSLDAVFPTGNPNNGVDCVLVTVRNARKEGLRFNEETPTLAELTNSSVLFPDSSIAAQHRRVHFFGAIDPPSSAPSKVDSTWIADNGVEEIWSGSAAHVDSDNDMVIHAFTTIEDVPVNSGVFSPQVTITPFTWGGRYANVASLSIPYSAPPVCNDPSHVPVTITITAHGPVDVQVE